MFCRPLFAGTNTLIFYDTSTSHLLCNKLNAQDCPQRVAYLVKRFLFSHQQISPRMAASKLSPQDRLIRKRNAARLRQQRCRERKPMTSLKKASSTLMTSKKPLNPSVKASLPPRKLWKARLAEFKPHTEYSSDSSSVRSGIGRASSFDTVSSTCASFDSYCEDQQYYYCSSRNSSPVMDHPGIAFSYVNFEQRFPLMPNKEEAAIDAMMALKSEPRHYPPTPFRSFAHWDHYSMMAHSVPLRPGFLPATCPGLPYAV